MKIYYAKKFKRRGEIIKMNNTILKGYMTMKDEIIFFIPYLLKFNFLFKKELKKLKELERLSENELKILEFKKIKKLLKASMKTKFYKKLYEKHNIDISSIKSIDDFDRLPIITKEMIIGKEKELLTKPSIFLFKGSTSGTTGSSLNVYYDYMSVVKENAYIWRYRNICGLMFRDPVVSLRGYLSKENTSKYDRYTNTLYLSRFHINDENIYKYYSLLKEFSPKAILASPSSLYNLVLLLEEKGLSLNIELAFTSSEMLYEKQKRVIENFLETKFFDWYGTSERTIALQQTPKGYYEEPLLYSHNKYLERSIITTNLNNFSYPLIRYVINDVIEIKNSKITSILGRNHDCIILKDNSRVGVGGVIFKGINGIKFGQIVQNKKNEININIVESNFTEEDKRLLIDNIHKKLGEEIDFKINIVNKDKIIYMPSGKFKIVINNLF